MLLPPGRTKWWALPTPYIAGERSVFVIITQPQSTGSFNPLLAPVRTAWPGGKKGKWGGQNQVNNEYKLCAVRSIRTN